MNRLAAETSPYLRQHRDNPVDWYPWGEEAFEEARRRDVPLLVSIGYSACHWCHVMAHESFEDEETARRLNASFVCVKVDREERPDVDALYMEAVQAIHGHGGWPLNVFADHDGKPFFGGTYYPPTGGRGTPAFSAVLESVTEAWTNRRGSILEQSGELSAAVARRISPPRPLDGGSAPDAGAWHAGALERIEAIFDAAHGGIGQAPKFPQAPILELLLRAAADPGAQPAGTRGPARTSPLDKVVKTLEEMAAGGIYDHLGGGFARYSVDRRWQVPHFEKMLYDQAMLARVLLHAWQLTGDRRWRQVLDETVGYVLRELRDPGGGLRSSQDADSEGEEGRFYTWTPGELAAVLGAPRAALAASWYGVTPAGNFEGRSILHREPGAALERPDDVEAIRAELLAAREQRIHPGLDDKVLTEWNAMFASVLAEAGAATGTATWLRAAEEIGEYLLSGPRRSDGRWLRSYQDGRAAHLAVAADYAWLIDCFTRLGEATGRARWTRAAGEAAGELERLFSAPGGGYFTTGTDAEALFVRPLDTYDGVTPAAGSVASSALARLGALTGDDALTERARAAVLAAGQALASSPLAFPHLVGAARLLERGAVEVVVAGDRPDLVAAVQSRFLPDVVLAWGEPAGGPLWEGRSDDRAYVCRSGACLAPVSSAEDLSRAIDLAVRAAAGAGTGAGAGVGPGTGTGTGAGAGYESPA